MRRNPGSLRTLLAILLLGACTNPVSPEPHVRPTGFDILLGGERVVWEQDGALGGALVLPAGATLGPVTVQFREGANIVAPADDYFLEIVMANEAVARFTPTTPGALTGTFHGVAPGATTMRVRWMHGRVGSPRAHHDYQSPPVPVQVVAQ